MVRSWLPERRSCLIFDQKRGLMRGVVVKRGVERCLLHGAFVSYTTIQRGEAMLLEQLQLHALPACWARRNINFLHHLFELCAQFLPAHVADKQLFAHLVQIYRPLPAGRRPSIP
ncbi:MAG: hypothetical protein M1549_03945, partial [Candidatus Dependentiae bacterium]|nr:hypothetical protein [Candidatus Dependentiae bacterium]